MKERFVAPIALKLKQIRDVVKRKPVAYIGWSALTAECSAALGYAVAAKEPVVIGTTAAVTGGALIIGAAATLLEMKEIKSFKKVK